jgi:signal transduction histidine kinase/pSer/pThr/pTyr-binding forkhead associated (FHA) protein
MPHLLVIDGPDVDRRIELSSQSSVVLGRSPRCSVVLRDREVSRKHAEIFVREGDYCIRDLGSSNGTIVNGEVRSVCSLADHDRIQLGSNLMVFVGQGGLEVAELDSASSRSAAKLANYDIEIVKPQEASPSVHGNLSQIRHTLEPRTAATFDQIGDDHPESGDLSQDISVASGEHADAYWQMMYRAVIQISRTSDASELVQQILGMIFQWIKCDRACILLLDPTSKSLVPAGRLDRNRTARSSAMQISHTILEYVRTTGEAILTGDAVTDERWNTSASIAQAGVREAICVPMPGRHGLVGVIYIDTSASIGHLSQGEKLELLNIEHLKLLSAIGHHAALVLEDAYNYRMMLRSERLATIGTVVASISHHIKNILQGIEGGGYLVNSALKNNDIAAVTQGWNIVEKNQRRIKSLVLDMLAYGKERQPQLAEHNINSIVQDAVDLMRPSAQDQGVEIRFQSELSAIVYGEADAIYHAIVNLITNAVDTCIDKKKSGQFEGYKPLVEVVIRVGKSHVDTLVTDNGTGMDAQQMEKAFVAFESTKGAGGSGLGLAVSRKIINEHGGNITVTSELGMGSCFVIQLPTETDQDPPRNSGDQTLSL